MTFVNTPAFMLAAGFQWASYGGHAVLAAHGTAAYQSGDSGSMRIGPDPTGAGFGYETTGNMVVGASASGIRIEGTGANAVAKITYPYAGTFPVLWFTPDLHQPFTVMDGAAWVDNGNGTATATAPATAERGFWRATATASAELRFFSDPPAHFKGGVYGSQSAPPVVFDSTVTVRGEDGNLYTIPAQRN